MKGGNLNFADNLFILNVKIRAIKDTLALDADPDFFLENICNEIELVSRVSGALLMETKQNVQLVDRSELLYAFFETENRFLAMLASVEQGRACFSFENYPEIESKIIPIRDISRKRKEEILVILQDRESRSGDPRVVSSAEMSELLKGFS
jgi:hypothetical protein